MEHSVYMELQRRLSNFYFKKVQPNKERYKEICKSRKKHKNIIISLCVSILLVLILSFESLLLAAAVFVLSVISILIYSLNSNSKATVNNMAIENDIKTELMGDFVKIFGDLHWQPGTIITRKVGTAGELFPQAKVKEYKKNEVVYSSVLNPMYYKNVEKVKSLNLFNLALLGIDDCIQGSYQNVQFSIIEAITISTAKLILPVLAAALFSVLPLAIIIILIILISAYFMIITKYYALIDFLAKFGIPKVASVVISAAVFVLAIKLVIQLVINPLKPYMGYFRGVIVEFAMNKNFEGHTIILDNSNDGRKVKIDKNKFSEVKLEDVEFAKNYTVYSTNQIEARYLITTAFIDRLKNLKTKFNSKYIRVAFKDEKIVIAVHTDRDMFNMSEMFEKSERETFMKLFDEISSVLDFIDQLKLNSKLGL